jgi:GntR family transcriptional regulator
MPKPPTPTLSERLHEQLGRLIAETAPGERLPSEPALAKELGVSRATLREAMRTFETQGLLLRRQGVGTFVNHPPQIIDSGLEVLDSVNTLAERTGLPVKLGDHHIDSRVASEQERELFDLESGAEVVQVIWVVEAESRPVAYLIDILPEEVLSVKELERDFNGSVLDLLLQRGDLALTTSRTDINAVAAEPEVARALGIQRGDVVLRFTATLYTDTGRVIDYSYSYFLPGYFRFHVVRRVGKSGGGR